MTDIHNDESPPPVTIVTGEHIIRMIKDVPSEVWAIFNSRQPAERVSIYKLDYYRDAPVGEYKNPITLDLKIYQIPGINAYAVAIIECFYAVGCIHHRITKQEITADIINKAIEATGDDPHEVFHTYQRQIHSMIAEYVNLLQVAILQVGKHDVYHHAAGYSCPGGIY
jgi:hypothetical protein